MSEQKYELAFYGKLAEGCSLAETKEQVAQLFKTGVEQIERMFTGSRVVIRNKMDADTAQKYVIALRKRGAICQIEEMGFPGVVADLNASSAAASFDSTSATQGDVQHEQVKAEQPSSSSNQASVSASNLAANAQAPLPKGGMSATGLPIVGDKVDEILRASNFDIAPVGTRLEEEKKQQAAELHALDNVGLAPVGSDLGEKKETPPVSVPDISHIQLAPK